MLKNVLILSLFLALSVTGQSKVPTVDDLINLKSIGASRISPDGRLIVYTVTETDWKQDAYVTHLWLVPASGGEPIQLTRGDKSVGGAQWSPDGAWIAFSTTRVGDKNQIFAIRPNGGEAVQLTKSENGVGSFAWAPDGKTIAYTSSDLDAKQAKERADQLGPFELVRREYVFQQLWTVDVAEAFREPTAGKQRTKGRDFTIGQFEWSPDGSRIAFSASVNSDLVNGHTSDIYVFNTADDSVRKIVSTPGPDNGPRWSPDGNRIAYSTAMGNPKYYFSNTRIAVVPAEGGSPRSLTDSFDEQPGIVEWNADGIWFGALQKTASHLFRLDPTSGAITRVSAPADVMLAGGSFSRDGKTMAFTAPTSTTLTELYVTGTSNFAPRKLTSMSRQIEGFKLGSREVISWKSTDGELIEGVLIKPADFDPAKKYPVLCIIHGGPTGIDRPTVPDARYYPSDIWAARGALVLKVNYRGSAGYGERFRSLNYRNLGVGDAWDVLSGIDHLIAKGWADPNRLGSMGWSQGGYISAFLTTGSDRFKAISVGAGISNWETYYYNTDITPFTIQYLGDDPADDPAVYAKTSPMTLIKQAKTPTLIQHGENDRRVPIANAYELRQGLEDRNVPVEMVVYKGFGHGITKPKSMRAVMQHNLNWFNHFIFGDPLGDFRK